MIQKIYNYIYEMLLSCKSKINSLLYISCLFFLSISTPVSSSDNFSSVMNRLTSADHINKLSLDKLMSKTKISTYKRDYDVTKLERKFYKIEHNAENSPQFFGKGISIEKIVFFNDVFKCKDNKYCRRFAIILNRPGNDNGSGVINPKGLPFKIQYWIGDPTSKRSTALAALQGGYDIKQIRSKNPQEIILLFEGNFVPGRYYMKIVPFPYPSTYGATVQKFMEYYRHDYKSYFESLYNLMQGASIKAQLIKLAADKAKDVSLDTLMLWIADNYGIDFILDIPAIMPRIVGTEVSETIDTISLHGIKLLSNNKCTEIIDENSLAGEIYYSEYPQDKQLYKYQEVEIKYYCGASFETSNSIDVPDLRGMTALEANLKIKSLGLYPFPRKCTPTKHKNLDKKVYYSKEVANSDYSVEYNYYCYKDITPEINFSKYKLCPKQNPGKKSSYKFDSNDNTKDKKYLICKYKGKSLYEQRPTVNGKLHGLYLKYFSRLPDFISKKVYYANGKRHGESKSWAVDKNNKHYLNFHSFVVHGTVMKTLDYNKNGKLESCSMRESIKDKRLKKCK